MIAARRSPNRRDGNVTLRFPPFASLRAREAEQLQTFEQTLREMHFGVRSLPFAEPLSFGMIFLPSKIPFVIETCSVDSAGSFGSVSHI